MQIAELAHGAAQPLASQLNASGAFPGAQFSSCCRIQSFLTFRGLFLVTSRGWSAGSRNILYFTVITRLLQQNEVLGGERKAEYAIVH